MMSGAGAMSRAPAERGRSTGQATARTGVSRRDGDLVGRDDDLELISLPTSQPPASSATFQSRPHSSRSSLVVAVRPNGGRRACPGTMPLNSASKVAGRVTSLMVRSPVTR